MQTDRLTSKNLFATIFTLILIISGSIHSRPANAAKNIKVSYLSPPTRNVFWHNALELMKAVAEDLDIELTVVVSEGASFKYAKNGQNIINAAEKPDYFIVPFWRDVTSRLLNTAETRGVKTFTIVMETDEGLVGKPREKFKNWIGHMSPDNLRASQDLTELLISKAKTDLTGASNIKVLGLGGTPESAASNLRDQGFQSALSGKDEFQVTELVHCGWKKDPAYRATEKNLLAHPETKVVWAGSYLMALGAIDAIKNNGQIPGKDVYVGGFDWAPEALSAVKSGELQVSSGGHFIEAALTLILLHDYHHGVDFERDPGVQSETPIYAITPENVNKYEPLLNNPDWSSIDFKTFSKQHNKSLTTYKFNIESLLNALEASKAQH